MDIATAETKRDDLSGLGLYIPTRGRLDRQYTWEGLPPRLRNCATLVAPKNEVAAHRKMGRRVVGCPVSGIGNVRQWILETADKQFVWMIDDDLRFFRRVKPGDWHLKSVTEQQFLRLAIYLKGLLQHGYAHVNICLRQSFLGASESRKPYIFFGRQCQTYAFHRRVLQACGVRFRLNHFEDFDVALQLLRLGYINPCVIAWAQDQAVGSNMKGGCSLYRNLQTMVEQSSALRSLHPGFVTLRSKSAKTTWKGMQDDRMDVNVKWQEALLSATGLLHGDHGRDDFEEMKQKVRSQFGLLSQPEIVIHEHFVDGSESHSRYSPEHWQFSKRDPKVIARWTHRESINCGI